mgnify:CR=1 FL=1
MVLPAPSEQAALVELLQSQSVRVSTVSGVEAALAVANRQCDIGFAFDEMVDALSADERAALAVASADAATMIV